MQQPTPLIDLTALACRLGIARLWMKDESRRDLGNFKSLGGRRAAEIALGAATHPNPTLICASDGNHGLAVAAGAHSRGGKARIYLPRTTIGVRVRRIAALGAEVVLVDGSYDEAVEIAKMAAKNGHGILVPDTSTDPDDPMVAEVMEGYSAIPAEIIKQLGHVRPTHAFVQAGVGGLAAAVARGMDSRARGGLRIVVVEPVNAACVGLALRAGRPMQYPGNLGTCAEMLSCGLASAGALRTLVAAGCQAMTVDETGLANAPVILEAAGGPPTSPSGAAGLAGLLAACSDAGLGAEFGLGPSSRVVTVATEGPNNGA